VKRLMRNKAIFVFLFSASAFSILQAQVDTATIVGTVQDSSGAIVPGASVTATEVNTNIKTSTRTDTAGNYVLTPLKIGNYAVAVEAQGFKKETRGGVVLQVQDRVRVDFALQIGSISEAISIEADVPVVQTESSSLGDVIASRQITDLPLNGRDYTQLATLTTGVTKITENGGGINGATSATNGNAGGAFAVNGTRGNLNNFMLDGIDNNSNDNAGNILRTSVDAIAEFKVQTSNYSAEFGRSGGAVILTRPSSPGPTSSTERCLSSSEIPILTPAASSNPPIRPRRHSNRISSVEQWADPSRKINSSFLVITRARVCAQPILTLPRCRRPPRSAAISADFWARRSGLTRWAGPFIRDRFSTRHRRPRLTAMSCAIHFRATSFRHPGWI
jgi:hypothetical protein